MSSTVRIEPVATVLHLEVALRIVRPDCSCVAFALVRVCDRWFVCM